MWDEVEVEEASSKISPYRGRLCGQETKHSHALSPHSEHSFFIPVSRIE